VPAPQSEDFSPPAGIDKVTGFWRGFISVSTARQRKQLVAATIGFVLVIGLVDLFSGFEISLLVFYFVPVCLAVASLGWRFGAVIAVASVATWLIGDYSAGVRYGNPLVPWWNAIFALGTYFLVIWLFQSVMSLTREMEERVRQRTAALTQVIAERERLEKAILEISERERRSIGHDLHDDLGQHLTGTAFAVQVLADKLLARGIKEEEADAWKIVGLIEEGIEKTRRLAHGLLPAEISRDGLVAALQELAEETTGQFGVPCEFKASGEVRLAENDSATHLFRIVQEAISNAIRHGKTPRISIVLSAGSEGVSLAVHDEGSGLVLATEHGAGQGLGIMAHRAEIIGGRLTIAERPGGGTSVTCRLPSAVLRHD
jgi:signal transduction histidine kinase